MSTRIFAAIVVGSFELTMKIFEFSGKNNMKEIDCLSRRLALGSDTYAHGRISNEKLDEICRTLKEFGGIMRAYKAEACRAYGTSAIREAENSVIIQDQITQRTGIEIRALSNSEQRFLNYKSVASRGESFRRIIEERTAILDIGGGSIQISLFDNDMLVSTQNLRLGVLRIQEYTSRFEVKHSRLESFIDEMAMAQLADYKKLYLKDREIQNLIVLDDYISPLAVKLHGGNSGRVVLDREAFEKFSTRLRGENPAQAAKSLGMPEENMPLAFISAVLTGRIADLMGARQIWAPGATLCDGIAYEYAEKIKMFRGEHDFEKDILACAVNISKRYMGSKKHSETLEEITTVVFDSMKKVHGLGKRELLYLRLAAILHDCGRYISMVNTGETSYDIIMATEIIGLSHGEREIVANIVRFSHGSYVYHGQPGMDRETYLKVAKLTAILRLSNGLDRSYRQKVKGIKAVLTDNQLLLTVDASEDITLEKGFFKERTEFFREVFSVEPILKQKKALQTQTVQK